MRLRRQLILVSLLTLSLPWAGCQYIREMESTMRLGQVVALTASARAVADRIRTDPQLVEHLQQNAYSAEPGSQLYAHPLPAPIILDGYDDDWRYLGLQQKELRQSQTRLRYTVGEFNNTLSLFIQVDDADITYHNPAKAELASGDHLVLRSRVAEAGAWVTRDYIIRSGAPGNVTAVYLDRRQPQHRRVMGEAQIRGYWQERQGG